MCRETSYYSSPWYSNSQSRRRLALLSSIPEHEVAVNADLDDEGRYPTAASSPDLDSDTTYSSTEIPPWNDSFSQATDSYDTDWGQTLRSLTVSRLRYRESNNLELDDAAQALVRQSHSEPDSHDSDAGSRSSSHRVDGAIRVSSVDASLHHYVIYPRAQGPQHDVGPIRQSNSRRRAALRSSSMLETEHHDTHHGIIRSNLRGPNPAVARCSRSVGVDSVLQPESSTHRVRARTASTAAAPIHVSTAPTQDLIYDADDEREMSSV